MNQDASPGKTKDGHHGGTLDRRDSLRWSSPQVREVAGQEFAEAVAALLEEPESLDVAEELPAEVAVELLEEDEVVGASLLLEEPRLSLR